MLGLWGTQSIPLLLSLIGPLWLGVVASNRVLCIGQIVLNCVLILNWITYNRTVFTYKNGFSLEESEKTPIIQLRSLLDYYPWERHETRSPSSYELNSTMTVLLQGLLWLWITDNGWYAIKPNQILFFLSFFLSFFLVISEFKLQSAIGQVVPLLFFYKGGFDIK